MTLESYKANKEKRDQEEKRRERSAKKRISVNIN